MPKVEPLSPEQLCRRGDSGALTFETTAELDEPTEVLGQERALEALRFGIGMARDGYNIFALGPPGLGKHIVDSRIFESKAADLQSGAYPAAPSSREAAFSTGVSTMTLTCR